MILRLLHRKGAQGAPRWVSTSQVGGICACAAQGGSPNKANVYPALSWRECGLRGRLADKKGNTYGFPLLANQPHSL